MDGHKFVWGHSALFSSGFLLQRKQGCFPPLTYVGGPAYGVEVMESYVKKLSSNLDTK